MRAENRFNWRLFALILVLIAMVSYLLPFSSITLQGDKAKDLTIDKQPTFERSYSGFKILIGSDDKIKATNPDGSVKLLKPKITVKRDMYLVLAFLLAGVFCFYYTIRSRYRPFILGGLSLGAAVLMFLHYINSQTAMITTASEMLNFRKLDNIFTLDALGAASKTAISLSPGIGFFVAAGAFVLAAVLCLTGKETEKTLKPLLNFDNYGYYFVVPFILVYALFSLYPILYSFYISLTDMTLMRTDGKDTTFVGLQNYTDFLADKSQFLSTFISSFKNTWVIWLWNFFPQIGLAILLSVWFTDLRLKLRFTGAFKTLYYLPNVITQASVAVLFNALFLFRGPINLLLVKQFDIIPEAFDYLNNVGWTRAIVSFIQTWLWYGNTLILVIAGMMGISPTYYEAAMVDGANSGQMFTHVTLPNLRPLLKYVLVTSLIGGMQMFDIPFMLTNGLGQPDGSIRTMTMYLYNVGFRGNNAYGRAAVVAVAMFVVILVCNFILNTLLKDRDKSVAVRRRAKA